MAGLVAALMVVAASAGRADPVEDFYKGKQLRIIIENVAFGEAPTDARVGDIIEWLNRDFVAHTATAGDGSFDVIIPGGTSARTALREAGVITFFCRYHPNMTGSLRVSP